MKVKPKKKNKVVPRTIIPYWKVFLNSAKTEADKLRLEKWLSVKKARDL